MSSFRIRPRFEHKLKCSPEELKQRLTTQAQSNNTQCEVKSAANQIYLLIPPEQQHFWSPQLLLQFESEEAGSSLIKGLYGPNPNVWILFIYGYAASGILGTFMLIIGLSQWSLGETMWGMWIFGVCALLALGLYILAQTGQKIGANQTFRLHHCYEEAIDGQIEMH